MKTLICYVNVLLCLITDVASIRVEVLTPCVPILLLVQWLSKLPQGLVYFNRIRCILQCVIPSSQNFKFNPDRVTPVVILHQTYEILTNFESFANVMIVTDRILGQFIQQAVHSRLCTSCKHMCNSTFTDILLIDNNILIRSTD